MSNDEVKNEVRNFEIRYSTFIIRYFSIRCIAKKLLDAETFTCGKHCI